MTTIENQINYAKSREGAEAPSPDTLPGTASPRLASRRPAYGCLDSNSMEQPPAKIIKKGWGEERVVVNNNLYCLKILEFDRSGAEMSLHFHMQKTEHWLCLNGEFTIAWIEPDTGAEKSRAFLPDDIWANAPGDVHRLTCISPGLIVEVSTPDSVHDSYRVAPGDSQKAGRFQHCPQCPRPLYCAENPDRCKHPVLDGAPERVVPRHVGAEVPASYEVTCDHATCGRTWIMKEPMVGWHTVRCPGCTKSVSEAMWEKRRALPFTPTP